jgi:hypothetical protein
VLLLLGIPAAVWLKRRRSAGDVRLPEAPPREPEEELPRVPIGLGL